MQLRGTHVLVTGASRGIGAAVVERLAAQGAVVTLVARDAERLEALAATTGGHVLACDLGDPLARAGLVDRAQEQAGAPVDVLVNNAGIDGAGLVTDLTADALTALVQINVAAPLELCRQAATGMVERGRGLIVNVSSGFSTFVAPGLAPYCGSKAALSHFTAGLDLELAGTGVGTCLIELGPTQTDMIAGLQEHPVTAAALRRFLASKAIRTCPVDEVADAIVAGIAKDRTHVVVPARMRSSLAPVWGQRAAGRLLLKGLPNR